MSLRLAWLDVLQAASESLTFQTCTCLAECIFVLMGDSIYCLLMNDVLYIQETVGLVPNNWNLKLYLEMRESNCGESTDKDCH